MKRSAMQLENDIEKLFKKEIGDRRSSVRNSKDIKPTVKLGESSQKIVIKSAETITTEQFEIVKEGKSIEESDVSLSENEMSLDDELSLDEHIKVVDSLVPGTSSNVSIQEKVEISTQK
jgi:hypothetical protein